MEKDEMLDLEIIDDLEEPKTDSTNQDDIFADRNDNEVNEKEVEQTIASNEEDVFKEVPPQVAEIKPEVAMEEFPQQSEEEKPVDVIEEVAEIKPAIAVEEEMPQVEEVKSPDIIEEITPQVTDENPTVAAEPNDEFTANEEDVIVANEIEELTNTKKLSKEELLGKTYNLSEELVNVKANEPDHEETDNKKSITFIAFLFIFLILFVMALPLISKMLSS